MSLSKRPETRYQDGDQFAADLRAVLGLLGDGGDTWVAQASAAGGAAASAEDKTQVMQASTGADQATKVMQAAASQEKTQVFTRPDFNAATVPAELMATDRFAATQKFTPQTQSPVPPVQDDPFEKTIVARPAPPDAR